jgi:hypothetical protein
MIAIFRGFTAWFAVDLVRMIGLNGKQYEMSDILTWSSAIQGFCNAWDYGMAAGKG